MTDSINKCPVCDRALWHGHEDGCPDAVPNQQPESERERQGRALATSDRRDRARGIT
ncbi:MAG: hypothetical protein IT356_12525 [Gemmatimonadaceae bacterium]|nr:hypothetical protein [Gemmatimonadaceae bacterium]